MSIIFTNSDKNKTCDAYMLKHNFGDKIDLRREACCIIIPWYLLCMGGYKKVTHKQWIKDIRKNREWRLLSAWWILCYIRYSRLFQKHHQKALVKIYVNKTQSRVTFKIKSGYYLKLLTPKIMKLLGSIKKNKIIKIKTVRMYRD